MAYIHTLELKLAKSSDSIRFKDYLAEIGLAASMYNKASSSATNPKSLSLIDVTNNTIIVKLSSEAELQAVGKALRFFSQTLLNKIPFLGENITSSGQLFKINEIGMPVTDDADSSIQLKVLEIDDSTLIKSLVDYVCKKRDPKTSAYIKKQKALEQMKQIALESGIIELP